MPRKTKMIDARLTARLAKDTTRCPGCGSDQLDASDYDGGHVLSCKVECAECGSSWYEHYTFTSASGFEEG